MDFEMETNMRFGDFSAEIELEESTEVTFNEASEMVYNMSPEMIHNESSEMNYNAPFEMIYNNNSPDMNQDHSFEISQDEELDNEETENTGFALEFVNEDEQTNNMETEYMDAEDENVETEQEENTEFEETEMEEEVREDEQEQPLYKLKNIDTQASIKTEIKQLIVTKIAEEINVKALNDIAEEVEEQVALLKHEIETVQNENQELEQEVEIDEERLTQSEGLLIKTDEMVGLLNENMETISVQYRESYINELSEKCLKQLENRTRLSRFYVSKIKQEKLNIQQLKTSSDERQMAIHSDILHKKNVLYDKRKKLTEFEHINESHNEIMRNQAERKLQLGMKQNKLADKKMSFENEFTEQKNILNSIVLKKEYQMNKLKTLKENEENLSQQVNKLICELDNINAKISTNEEKTQKARTNLKQFSDTFETLNTSYLDDMKLWGQNYDENCLQLNTIINQNSTTNNENRIKETEINKLKTMYIERCEEKALLIKNNMDVQNQLHDVKVNLLRKQIEGEIAKNKLDDLSSQLNLSTELITSINDTIIKEQKNLAEKFNKSTIELEKAQANNNKCLLDISKKREYAVANGKYLEEKSESLKLNTKEATTKVKKAEEEAFALKMIIDSKRLNLDNLNSKLLQLKDNKIAASKPEIKCLKKVQFNDIVSFKSPTSSENSIRDISNTKQGTSFHDWLNAFPNSSQADAGVVEEEL